MKRYIYTLCVILVGSSCLSSCFKDKDTNVTVYNETAITGLQLTGINRYVHGKTSKGNDTIYVKKLTSFPKFSVDHFNGKIFNADSLPSDCDLTRVVISLSTSTYTGTLLVKTLDSDEYFFFNSTDSIDFTQPRDIRAYNTDGSLYKSYQVTMNKHGVATGQLFWEERPLSEYPTQEDEENAKWEQIVKEAGLKAFIGAAREEAYAFSNDGKLMVSRDNGATWEADLIDSDPVLLPVEDFHFVVHPLISELEDDYVLLTGVSSVNPVESSVWRKIVENSEYSIADKWAYLPIETYNLYDLPTNVVDMTYYGGMVMAFTDLGEIYTCRDDGITWKIYRDVIAFPMGEEEVTNFSVTTDNRYIWFKDKSEGRVWRGIYLEK